MTGTPEGSTESDFMEKPGIKPATPGLQGIALIHYTTGASQVRLWMCRVFITELRIEHSLQSRYPSFITIFRLYIVKLIKILNITPYLLA